MPIGFDLIEMQLENVNTILKKGSRGLTARRTQRRRENELRLIRRRYERHRRANLLAKPGKHSFIIVLDNLKPNFNVPKIFRSADAFGAREVHLVGINFFDPAPAKGSFKYVPARFFDSFEPCVEELMARGYAVQMLDPSGSQTITNTTFQEKSAFVFGHEEFGFSFDPSQYPDIQKLSVPQFGRVQSLNVSIAASIVMYEYVRQHGGVN